MWIHRCAVAISRLLNISLDKNEFVVKVRPGERREVCPVFDLKLRDGSGVFYEPIRPQAAITGVENTGGSLFYVLLLMP